MKKNKLLLVYTLFLSVIAVFSLLPIETKAASATITTVAKNLTQTDSSTDSVTFSWSAATYSGSSITPVYYYKQIAKDASFTQIVETAGPQSLVDTTVTYQFDGLDPGTTYYVRVGSSMTYTSAYTSTATVLDEITTNQKWSDVLEVVTSPKDATITLKQTAATTTSISLSWDTVSGANGYRLCYWKYLGESDSDAKEIILTSNSKKLTGLKKNTKYSFRVYALRTSGTYTAEGSYGQLLGVGVRPTKMSGVDVVSFHQKASKHNFKFEFDERDSASIYKYEVYRYDGKKLISGTTTSTSNRINSKTLSKSKNVNCFYYLRVRAGVKLSSGTYSWGSWSDAKYFSRLDGENVKLKKSGSGMKVSWKKVKGATGYIIYVGRSTKANAAVSYKKVATVSGNKTFSKTLSKKTMNSKKVPFTPGKYYYVRVVAVKKVNGKTYKSVINSKKSYCAMANYTYKNKFYAYTLY
ncbi:MAG: fibronectin type III domain-containing protein [Lachnospiraceae bacterium]|nr:fibronectin type III domain-containing protein [Lachnospiraceae bacterium]